MPDSHASMSQVPVGTFRLQVFGASELGRVRQRNEDSIAVGTWMSAGERSVSMSTASNGEGPLALLVSDGMGGQAGGDVASECVIRHLSQAVWDPPWESVLAAAAGAADSELQDRMGLQPDLMGMGATIAGVLIAGHAMMHFNVGDSRVYHLSRGRLTRLSQDDRLAGTHALTQVMGGSRFARTPRLDFHVGHLDLRDGDVVLVCSDGLSDLVDDAEMENLLASGDPDAPAQLVQMALDRGGIDNISLVLAEVGSSERPESASEV